MRKSLCSVSWENPQGKRYLQANRWTTFPIAVFSLLSIGQKQSQAQLSIVGRTKNSITKYVLGHCVGNVSKQHNNCQQKIGSESTSRSPNSRSCIRLQQGEQCPQGGAKWSSKDEKISAINNSLQLNHTQQNHTAQYLNSLFRKKFNFIFPLSRGNMKIRLKNTALDQSGLGRLHRKKGHKLDPEEQ